MLPFKISAASRTQTGSVVGISMHTSHFFPLSASSCPLRSPISCSASFGSSPGCVLPRLNTVTLCPRLSAYFTWNGPVKPLPPRIRIRSGFAALPLDETDLLSADMPGTKPRPTLPLASAESLRNFLLLVDMICSLKLMANGVAVNCKTRDCVHYRVLRQCAAEITVAKCQGKNTMQQTRSYSSTDA